MDLDRIEHLARSLASAGTRRHLMGRLVRLPALGALLGILDSGETDAKDRRRRRKQRHKRRKHPGDRKKGCRSKSKATICAGQCGPVKSRQTCGKTVDCGSCACVPDCAGKCGGADDGCGGTCTGSCAANELCLEQSCRTCDVCQAPAVCAFTSVQAAVDATAPQLDTIVVCPGSYLEQSYNPSVGLILTRSLRLIGAGDGADPTSNTHLRPQNVDPFVVAILGGSGDVLVTLESVRITGGSGLFGSGLNIVNGPEVTLQNVSITDNHPTTQPGGMLLLHPGTQVSLINTRVTGNSGVYTGGVFVNSNATLTLDALSRVTGNTTTRGNGGIYASITTTVTLPSVDNVTGNTSPDANCGGDGSFNGPGAICTTT